MAILAILNPPPRPPIQSPYPSSRAALQAPSHLRTGAQRVSIEQRHMQIREKAGLEDARLNKEFIGFLQKWSTPLMAIIAVAALGYVGMGKLKAQRIAKVDAAFREFQSVSLGGTLNASPDSLLGVADAFDDVAGVAILARLGAADALLQSVRTGLRPGAVLKADNTPESPDDLLSPADRLSALDRAAGIYSQVLDRAAPVPGQELHVIGALYGLAAVESMKGDTAAAKAHLTRVKELSEAAKFDLHVKIATARLAALENPAPSPALVSQSELPKPPEAPQPLVPEATAPAPQTPEAAPTTPETATPPATGDSAAPPTTTPPATDGAATGGDPKPASADGPK